MKMLSKYNVNGVLKLSAVSTHPSEFTLVPDHAQP